MKKRVILIIKVFILLLACFLLFKISQKQAHNKAIALQVQSLPAFRFYGQDLKPFSSKLLKENVPVCIFFYDADCEHCQYEATQISNNIALFKGTQICMVSTNTPAITKAFSSTYKLSQYPFITWLYDKDYSFYKWFGSSVTPSVFIYNPKHNLVKVYQGEVKTEAILKYLAND